MNAEDDAASRLEFIVSPMAALVDLEDTDVGFDFGVSVAHGSYIFWRLSPVELTAPMN